MIALTVHTALFWNRVKFSLCEPRFQKLGKAVGVKDGYLDRHVNSADHSSSSERVFSFLHCIKNAGTDIHAKIDKGAAEVQIRTKKGIISIIDVVIALGQRGIPFRGNWSGDGDRHLGLDPQH